MADFSITATLVKASPQAKLERGVAGATLTAGSAIYRDPADNKFKLADANGATDAQTVDGIALTGSSDGQPVIYTRFDRELDLGVTVGSGVVVVLSTNPGKLAPDSDITSGGRKIVVGVGIGGTKIHLSPVKGGIVS